MIAIDFVNKMEKTLSPLTYLHYNSYQNTDLSGANLHKLLQSQKNLFAERFNNLNKITASKDSYEQISMLLKN